MKTTLITIVTVAALGVLAACDRNPEPRTGATSPAAGSTTAPQPQQNTPANAGTPSAAEKREGSNPVQGQVDPKQSEQHKDFQQRGDGAGPKPGN